MDFEQLRRERIALNNAVLQHPASLRRFRPEGEAWFKLTPEERVEGSGLGVRHLSTSASCIESLHDIAPQWWSTEDTAGLTRLSDDFARGALEREKWESDGAAWVYSRVRTLPIILQFASGEALTNFTDNISAHTLYAWERLDPERPSAQGIAERAQRDGAHSADDHDQETAEAQSGSERSQQYPPNAFHTYWALRLLRRYRARQDELGLPDLSETITDLNVKQAVALLWCNRTLGAQTSLLAGRAARVDAQQLAWSLLADYEDMLADNARVREIGGADPAGPTRSVSERRELYEAGLKAFFGAQDEHSGAWPLYEPLFHYPGAGNAYCYSFETLAELIRPALREEGYLLRELLRDYLPNLIRAREFALRTALQLGGGAIGWCSGHHPHRQEAEGWATAAVFSFLQGMRRLVGYWTAQSARNELGARKTKFADARSAEGALRTFGTTWTNKDNPLSVGRQLAGLFLNPIHATAVEPSSIDPDAPLIPDQAARSAILYGPPGTGKTTLVEGLAGAIGWDFVEVSAAAFVNRGIDQVPARAEEIFAQLMEIDRAVVLFDEVDELIRRRAGDGTEAFGRFLTTSMLPKLAKLWDQRRVLFFVATNSITRADPAIRRSQRFDASIFVAPPSFAHKRSKLAAELDTEPPQELNYEAVAKALAHDPKASAPPLWAFALLRWDQISELAQKLRAGEVTYPRLESLLSDMGLNLARVEYRKDEEGEQEPPLVEEALDVWSQFWKELRRDHSRQFLLRIEDPATVPVGAIPAVGEENVVYLDSKEISAEQLSCAPDSDHCTLELDGVQFSDKGLLDFRRS
jgi:predicted ATPase